MLFVLLVMNLLFSVQTSITYTVALFKESVGKNLKFTIAAAYKIDVVSKSLYKCLPPMEMDV